MSTKSTAYLAVVTISHFIVRDGASSCVCGFHDLLARRLGYGFSGLVIGFWLRRS